MHRQRERFPRADHGRGWDKRETWRNNVEAPAIGSPCLKRGAGLITDAITLLCATHANTAAVGIERSATNTVWPALPKTAGESRCADALAGCGISPFASRTIGIAGIVARFALLLAAARVASALLIWPATQTTRTAIVAVAPEGDALVLALRHPLRADTGARTVISPAASAGRTALATAGHSRRLALAQARRIERFSRRAGGAAPALTGGCTPRAGTAMVCTASRTAFAGPVTRFAHRLTRRRVDRGCRRQPESRPQGREKSHDLPAR